MKKIIILLCLFVTHPLYALDYTDCLKFIVNSSARTELQLKWYYTFNTTDLHTCNQKFKDNTDQIQNILDHAQRQPFNILLTTKIDDKNPNQCNITCTSANNSDQIACQTFEKLSTINSNYQKLHQQLYECSVVNHEIIWPIIQTVTAYGGESYVWPTRPEAAINSSWQGFCAD